GQGIISYNNTDDSLRVTVNDVEAFRVTSSGRIGVNQTSPVEFIHIEPTGSASDTNGLRYTAFRPHITLEDKSTGSIDYQIWVDENILEVLYGDLSSNDKLTNTAIKVDPDNNLITLGDEVL